MSHIFPNDTVEGRIERVYKRLIKEQLGGGDPTEDFRRCLEMVEHETITPPNYGDLILERVNNDPRTRRYVEKLRRNGVRDEDIRSWYNMHILERSCILYINDLIAIARFFQLTHTGDMAPDDATIALFKELPRLGDPDGADWGGAVRDRLTDEDRPLPIEMYNAINDFMKRHREERSFQNRLAKTTSLNAVIREELRRGAL